MRFSIAILFLICTIDSFICHSQSADLTAQNKKEDPISVYKIATAPSQNLYNGRIYFMYDYREEEFQFFEARKWDKGTLFYEGQKYDTIPMMYDLVTDDVVILHFNTYQSVLLQAEKVKYFSMRNHTFERLVSGEDIDLNMKTGFYDVLHNGKTKLIMRRTKQRQEKIVEKRVITLFPEKDFYYVKKDNKYHHIYSKRSVYDLFPEYKSELRRTLRSQKKFRKDRENAITRMVSKYDELTSR